MQNVSAYKKQQRKLVNTMFRKLNEWKNDSKTSDKTR